MCSLHIGTGKIAGSLSFRSITLSHSKLKEIVKKKKKPILTFNSLQSLQIFLVFPNIWVYSSTSKFVEDIQKMKSGDMNFTSSGPSLITHAVISYKKYSSNCDWVIGWNKLKIYLGFITLWSSGAEV